MALEQVTAPRPVTPALSIMQPWAWLICAGYKDIENRKWWTKHRGEFLVHAGQKVDRDFDYEWAEAIIQKQRGIYVAIPRGAALQKGGIVGKTKLIACVEESPSPWFFGPRGFVLRDSQHLPFMPCKGQLGFFKP